MPVRPKVDNGYERQFVYVYGAVSPLQGQLDWMISPKMDTERMNQFLAQVSNAHADEFIVMVVDGASSHRSKDLQVPENIRLHRLPGYSPELNPRTMSGTNCARRSFPTEFLRQWTRSLVNSKQACRGWRQTLKRCEA
jgi:transposase-like protein